MAVPRFRDEEGIAALPRPPVNPFEVAEADARDGAYTLEQLNMMLQLSLHVEPEQSVWPAGQKIAFVVATSALLWLAIVFALLQLR